VPGSPESTVPLEDEVQAPQGKRDIVVENFTFSPATEAVPVGAAVTWTNHDDVPHIVVST
jgi:plastocyanin